MIAVSVYVCFYVWIANTADAYYFSECMYILYMHLYKCIYCIAGKSGSLAVCLCIRQIKIRQYFLFAYMYIIPMAIPYQTAKFKYANIIAMVILGPTAKFNSRQYFRLYGMYVRNVSYF